LCSQRRFIVLFEDWNQDCSEDSLGFFHQKCFGNLSIFKSLSTTAISFIPQSYNYNSFNYFNVDFEKLLGTKTSVKFKKVCIIMLCKIHLKQLGWSCLHQVKSQIIVTFINSKPIADIFTGLLDLGLVE
jgi:hypothetical protein